MLKLVKENGLNKNFKVDELIRSFGHIPLLLPPCQCQFNPIEYVWAQFKIDVSKHNFNNSLTQFKNLIPKSFEKISESFCVKCIRHVNKMESDYWMKDKIICSDVLNAHNYCNSHIN